MILITGATGNVGSAAVTELTRRGALVRALTRTPGRTRLPSGVETARGSTSDRAAMESALDGVESVFLNITGDPRPCLEALAVHGPKRVVLLSSLTAGTRPDHAYAAHFAELEQAVRTVAPDVTVLRPGQFASNVSWWVPMLDGGTVYAPFLDIGLPAIAPEDIGSVAAQALLDDEYAAQVLPMSGPALITPRQQIAVIADVTNRTLAAAELSEADFASRNGFDDPDIADYLIQVMGHPQDDELQISPTVAAVTGRPPLSFEAWAMAHRALFAGRPSSGAPPTTANPA